MLETLACLKRHSGGKPPTRSPKERVPGHRPVPGHLLVVRVLQENLTEEISVGVKHVKGFLTLTTRRLSSAYLATASSSSSSTSLTAGSSVEFGE